jgi:hypothetical protein
MELHGHTPLLCVRVQEGNQIPFSVLMRLPNLRFKRGLCSEAGCTCGHVHDRLVTEKVSHATHAAIAIEATICRLWKRNEKWEGRLKALPIDQPNKKLP